MLVRLRLLPRLVIIRMDGGICSQMHFYMVGKILEGNGSSVRYDTRWFRTSGTDLDGRFCRNFDLLRIFPGLKFEESDNRLLNRIYISLFYRRNDYFADAAESLGWMNICAPAYLDGYFRDPEEMYASLFRKTFHADTEVLDAENRRTLERIDKAGKNGETCAVHVRRGDLARYNAAYGEPADTLYFKESIRLVARHGSNVRFFIFSDEPEWCRENIMPGMEMYDIHLCDNNGSDKGWCDLILMSRCRHQVTSQGSMGKYAALLRDDSDMDGLVTVLPGDNADTWIKRYKNAVSTEISANAT